MAAADDKRYGGHLDLSPYTAKNTNPGTKNIVAELSVMLDANHPAGLAGLSGLKIPWFWALQAPNNTDFPDSQAPIGSLCFVYTVTSGAITGASMYLKTAAATWTVMGSVA